MSSSPESCRSGARAGRSGAGLAGAGSAGCREARSGSDAPDRASGPARSWNYSSTPCGAVPSPANRPESTLPAEGTRTHARTEARQAPGHARHRDLLFAKYAKPANLPTPPAHFGHETLFPPKAWGMLGNDEWGDCALAGPGARDDAPDEGGTPPCDLHDRGRPQRLHGRHRVRGERRPARITTRPTKAQPSVTCSATAARRACSTRPGSGTRSAPTWPSTGPT